MSITFFSPRWGSEQLSWNTYCQKVNDAGYDGVEYAIARTTSDVELEEAWNCFEQYGLQVIAQHYDTYEADFNQHLDLYHAWLERIRQWPAVKINSQTGKDFFSFEQNRQLIQAAANSGLTVVHETHRNKFSFAAHVTKTYLEKIPFLQITLDASHWVCVAESLLEDQPEAMQLAIEHTGHIHSRVGYPEGPQVPDPRLPLWKDTLDTHLRWWDAVVALKKQLREDLTITTEFGPFPYMVPVPETGLPVADQWEINVFMLTLLRERYS